MNTQFHTPSFGDEEFDLTDVEPIQSVEISTGGRLSAFGNQSVPISAETRNSPPQAEMSEPVKPASAYGLFFRDTVSAIKAQNPNTSFEDISKIVSSMWQVLDPTHKNVYNKKTELAKKEYIKQMTMYRNIQQRQHPITGEEMTINNGDPINIAQSNISQKSTQIASRPAVFTIPRNGTDSTILQQEQQAIGVPNNVVFSNNISNTVSQENSSINPQENLHSLSDTGTGLICIRENCNKRAIINPDWEDEYCSNECVVIHCRNVFNQWVKSNMEGQT